MSEDAVERARALHQRHRELAAQLADIAEYSAEVHEQAAEVHETLPNPRLDPAALRDHAQRDRDLAASERAAAEEEPP